ncbi:hypothetical protein E6C50_10385 [Flavobacterium supellecticarium]|uniref:Uncharacterized protein n=1 Tax=Flavobacterium supellecticarium TaxID=2565924 RepID=A0A4S3ZXQ8_9FLAO|nr:hypothetical protein [Flavobacterium supellecticarium]THF50621.1 hypothetical protein E6C50_10385 [Flavobacterium supellecticarium]
MPREDSLMRQISELGFALKRLMERMKGGGSGGGLTLDSDTVNSALIEEMGFGLDTLLNVEPENIISFLLENPGFSADNLELFADYLTQIEPEKDYQENLYRKAVAIYDYVNKATATFSMERQNKIQAIRSKLK